jgi:hypothetical protein
VFVDPIHRWIDGYRNVWEAKDPDGAADLFTKDCSYRSNIFEEPYLGREGVRAYWADVTSTQSDVAVRMGEPFIDGSRVTVEFWTNMKVGGDEVTLPGCLLLTFDEDWLCSDLREYWHFQPGSLSPPTEWGT